MNPGGDAIDPIGTVDPVFVKICGVTLPADARSAAIAGADAIGLNFVPTSRRRIDVDTARSIVAVVPEGVMTVGVFRDQPVAEVIDIVEAVGVVAVQLHGDEHPDDVAAIADRVTTLIKVVSPTGPWAHPIDCYRADVVMLDAPTPGGGVPFDWGRVGEIAIDHRVLLAGGLTPDNVAEAIRLVRPWGVDVATGVELSPGRKDPDAILRFVTAAHAAGRAPAGPEPGTGVSGR